MIRTSTIFCFAFILTNAVLAQAAENGTTHIQTQKWVTAYSGDAEVDGLPVTANLDESQPGLQIPQAMAEGIIHDPRPDSANALVPSLMPVVKKSYRLNLIVSRSPLVQMTYAVEARRISIDGSVRFAYVSDLDPAKDIHFVITTEANGVLHVSYTHKQVDGNVSNGDFALTPVPHIL